MNTRGSTRRNHSSGPETVDRPSAARAPESTSVAVAIRRHAKQQRRSVIKREWAARSDRNCYRRSSRLQKRTKNVKYSSVDDYRRERCLSDCGLPEPGTTNGKANPRRSRQRTIATAKECLVLLKRLLAVLRSRIGQELLQGMRAQA